MNAQRPLVIGVGNPYRRDDGVGSALVAALRRRSDAGSVQLVEEPGDLTRVLPLWRGRSLVVLVDAAVCGCDAGTVHRAEPTGAVAGAHLRTAPLSSHGLGVADAIEVARALGAAPRRLVIFGVAAADLGHGLGLSPAVAAAVGPLADAVVAEVTSGSALVACAGFPYP